MAERDTSARQVAPAYWTAADLSRVLHAPLGTIYRWASEDHWPRTNTRPVAYQFAAAEASATRRRAGTSLLTCTEVRSA